MSWYKTGTVTVTNGSATVTGSGTAFVTNGLTFAGDIFKDANNVDYEILSIQSDTQLTLAKNYLGTTASGASYAIVPIGLLPSALAQQVSSTLSTANTALANTVRTTSAQGLTSTQQANAQANIYVPSISQVGVGRLSLSVAGGVNVTLTQAQADNGIIEFTGTLTANITVYVPSGYAREWLFANLTSGSYTLTVSTPSGTGIAIPQGSRMLLECDLTNIVDPVSAHTAMAITGASFSLAATLAAWVSTKKVFQFGPIGALTADSGTVALSSNAYINSSGNPTYLTSTAAAYYYQYLGTHVWEIAGSGTAGATISFVQAMTLDNSGNLLLGLTSFGYANSNNVMFAPSSGKGYFQHASGTGSGVTYVEFVYNASAIGTISQSGTSAVAYNTSSDPRLKNITGPVTAAAGEAFVKALKPVTGSWKSDGSPFTGFLATDYSQVDPTAVIGTPNATQPVGTVVDANGTVQAQSVPQPPNLPEGQTWTATGTAPVYQHMEYGSAAWCANMTAALQSALARIAALEAKA